MWAENENEKWFKRVNKQAEFENSHKSVTEVWKVLATVINFNGNTPVSKFTEAFCR